MDYLYYNQQAGADDDAERWYETLAQLDIAPQRPPLDNIDAVSSLTAEDRLLVAGGDGTLNYVAAACADTRCVVGVLPDGTANDFARGLNIGVDAESACNVIANGVIAEIDLAFVNDRPFLNVAHIGLGASISDSLESEKKALLGRFSYLAKVLEAIRRRRGIHAEVRSGEQLVRGRWLEVVVANGNSFGGGHPVLGADPCDGKLDVVGLRPRSLFALAFEWVRVHFFQLAPHPDVVVQLSHSEVSVHTRSIQKISADGEDAGETPANFRVRPAALRVLVPRA